MIDSVEPLSCVLWAVAFFAAGMYPLGFMMGAPCSPCCGVECLPLFYRCRRQVSLNGSVPPTPSETIYTLEDAYIYTASSESTRQITFTESTTHWRLRGNQFVTYETELTHYATGGVLAALQAPCQAVKPKVRVTVQGVTAPIEFPDTVLAAVASGGAVSRTANIVAGENLGGGNEYNVGATITTTVVAASVSGSTSKVDGAIVTEAFLRGLLTATTSAPASESTTCVVTASGNLAAFGYMTAAESCVISWLVQVVRDSVPHEFVVSVTVNGRNNFTALPAGGLAAVSVASLATPVRGIREAYAAPVVVRTSADYAITVKPRRNSSGNRLSITEKLSLAFPLAGRCRLGLWQRRTFGNVGGANQTIVATWSAPTVVAESTGTAGSFAFGNRDEDQFKPGEHLPSYAGDTIAFLPPWDTATVAGTYGEEQIAPYRDSGGVLPATSGTGLFNLSLVEPSQMCGMPVCKLPQALLPSAVSYTPAQGVMWGCRQARAMVLGNSASTVCTYSHTTNECLSAGLAFVSLYEMFTAWNTTVEVKAAKLDALTWLDYDVNAAQFVSAGSTFVFGGTYDPNFERYGGCYATTLAPPNAGIKWAGFIGSVNTAGLPARAATVGGGCFPAEVTINVPSFALTLPDIGKVGPDCPVHSWSPTIDTILSLQGDHVLVPGLGGRCDQMAYWSTEGFGNLGNQETSLYIFAGITLQRSCHGVNTTAVTAFFQAKAIHYTDLFARLFDSERGNLVVEINMALGLSSYARFSWFNVCLTSGGSVTQYLPGLFPTLVSEGGPLQQCSGAVGFTPTTLTLPITKQPSFTYGRPDRDNDVKATGPWMPCGYNRSLWNWTQGDSQLGDGKNPFGLPASLTVILPENDDSEPVTHTVTLTSDGSTPTDITVTVPGRCGTITTDTTAFFLVSGNTRRQIPVEPMRCVTIPVITGTTCSWTAVASGTIAIEEGTATGTGTGRVKAIRDAEGRLSGTITITLDAPIPANSLRYTYSPLIIYIG